MGNSDVINDIFVEYLQYIRFCAIPFNEKLAIYATIMKLLPNFHETPQINVLCRLIYELLWHTFSGI